MDDLCEIEVTIRSVRERSYKISGSRFQYTNNYQASLFNDLYTIPRSQVKEIRSLASDRQIMVLPKWLVTRNRLEKLLVNPNT